MNNIYTIIMLYRFISVYIFISMLITLYYLVLSYLDEAPIGDKGIMGERGSKGTSGIMGTKGPMGFRGPLGSKGPDNLNAKKGPRGFLGDIGNKGTQGNRGERGVDGDIGLKGDVGTQGLPGEPGIIGDRGKKGIPGIDNKPLYGIYEKPKCTNEGKIDTEQEKGDENNIKYEDEQKIQTIDSLEFEKQLRPKPGMETESDKETMYYTTTYRGLTSLPSLNMNDNWDKFPVGYKLKGDSLEKDSAKVFYTNLKIVNNVLK